MSIGWIVAGVLVAIALVAWVLLLRGERVGDLRCRAIIASHPSRARFVVKRSAGTDIGIPIIEFQTRVTLRLSIATLNDREALQLAEYLDKAVARDGGG